MIRIYALFDKLAASIVGGLHTFKHDAAAIRFFGDIAGDPKSFVAKHAADYDLLVLGTMDDQGVIDAEHPAIVISGAQWVAAQVPSAQEIK